MKQLHWHSLTAIKTMQMKETVFRILANERFAEHIVFGRIEIIPGAAFIKSDDGANLGVTAFRVMAAMVSVADVGQFLLFRIIPFVHNIAILVLVMFIVCQVDALQSYSRRWRW